MVKKNKWDEIPPSPEYLEDIFPLALCREEKKRVVHSCVDCWWWCFWKCRTTIIRVRGWWCGDFLTLVEKDATPFLLFRSSTLENLFLRSNTVTGRCPCRKKDTAPFTDGVIFLERWIYFLYYRWRLIQIVVPEITNSASYSRASLSSNSNQPAEKSMNTSRS